MTQHSFYEYEPQPLTEGYELSPNKQISAEYFMKLGNRHYNNYQARALKRDLDLALDHYRQALEMNPNLAEAYAKLASALWDKGEIPIETAIQYCRIGINLNSSSPESYLFLGYFLRKAGHLDEAIAQFRLAIERSAGNPAKPRMAMGRVMLQKASLGYELPAMRRIGLAADGLREFFSGCAALPKDNVAFGLLKTAFITDAKIFSLLGCGRALKTVGLKGQCGRLYEWAGRQMPNEPIFFHLMGDLQVEARRPEASIYYYNRAQELDPDNIQIHKKLGKVYHHCKDLANAAKSLEKVIEAEPENFDALYSLAQIYTDTSEYIRALYYFKELTRISPENPYIHSNMAYVMFKLEDYDGAVQEYQQAVSFGDDPIWTATVAQTLGTIYYQILQDIDGAVGMFQLAYQLDPTNMDCLTMLADIYTEQGNFDAAIRSYRYILTMEPDNADCYNYLGYLLWQMDSNQEAVEAYQKAIQFNDRNHIAYNNLGVIYLDEHCQLQKALEMFQKAVELKPDYTLACFNVGRVYEAMGRTTDAAKTYSEAIALNAENPELEDEEILDRLDHLFEAH